MIVQGNLRFSLLSLQSFVFSLTMDDPLSFDPKSPPSSSKKIGPFHVKFPVKRPSLQSLRPPFFQSSSSNSSICPIGTPRTRSPSIVPIGGVTFEDLESTPIPTTSPPLLPDDPFANLSEPPPAIPLSEHLSLHSSTSVTSYASRQSTVLLPSQAFLQHHTSTPKRPKSSGHGQVRPANTKPAFSPRPSLPSLHTLAQLNIGVPRKVRVWKLI